MQIICTRCLPLKAHISCKFLEQFVLVKMFYVHLLAMVLYYWLYFILTHLSGWLTIRNYVKNKADLSCHMSCHVTGLIYIVYEDVDPQLSYVLACICHIMFRGVGEEGWTWSENIEVRKNEYLYIFQTPFLTYALTITRMFSVPVYKKGHEGEMKNIFRHKLL